MKLTPEFLHRPFHPRTQDFHCIQFHQHFTSSSCTELHKTLLYGEGTCKTLMKLTPGRRTIGSSITLVRIGFVEKSGRTSASWKVNSYFILYLDRRFPKKVCNNCEYLYKGWFFKCDTLNNQYLKGQSSKLDEILIRMCLKFHSIWINF